MRPTVTKSMHFVDCINTLFRLNGIESIISRIENPKALIPLELVSNYIVGLSHMHGNLYRLYCFDIVPRLFVAVKRVLLETPDQYLKMMEKQKIDAILSSLDCLLKRVYYLGEKYQLIEELSFEMVTKLIQCPFLNQQITGI